MVTERPASAGPAPGRLIAGLMSLRILSGTKRTLSPGASSAAGERCALKSDTQVRPMIRQPPGDSRG